ncbi:MAG TPA: PEGA domain-containing protein [Thermoanaerobaculia bacterium]|nr:PEGA domain-containing protein [Thermoanaerobaculia bacterium]
MTPEAERETGEDEPEQALLPRWVPVLIGVVLVTLASLAVYTGLRYRGTSRFPALVPKRDAAPRPASPAPPGEPQPGASLILPGEAGDTTPAAAAPVTGPSRAIVSGDTAGTSAVVRIWARRGMTVRAEPADAVVSVNGVVVGPANQLDSPDEEYDFPAPGSYTIRISAPGYREQRYVVTATDSATIEVARIEAKLQKE